MGGVYLDTSALGRLVLDEPDAPAIGAALAEVGPVVASRLLAVELHRLGARTGVAAEEIDRWLSGVALVPLDDATLAAAQSVPPATVATLDAIHLATALGLAADGHVETLMTYDARLAAGAREHGLRVSAPT